MHSSSCTKNDGSRVSPLLVVWLAAISLFAWGTRLRRGMSSRQRHQRLGSGDVAAIPSDTFAMLEVPATVTSDELDTYIEKAKALDVVHLHLSRTGG